MIVGYSDASFANLRNASTQGGYIMFLYKDNKMFALIFEDLKIFRVTKSTLAAETLALIETIEASFMIRAILLETYKRVS